MRLNVWKRVAAVMFCLAVAVQVFPQDRPQTPAVPRIAPGDVLAIAVYDAPEFSRTVKVTASGDIRLPLLKDVVHVDGLLTAEAEKLIGESLIHQRLLVDPLVTITISHP